MIGGKGKLIPLALGFGTLVPELGTFGMERSSCLTAAETFYLRTMRTLTKGSTTLARSLILTVASGSFSLQSYYFFDAFYESLLRLKFIHAASV